MRRLVLGAMVLVLAGLAWGQAVDSKLVGTWVRQDGGISYYWEVTKDGRFTLHAEGPRVPFPPQHGHITAGVGKFVVVNETSLKTDRGSYKVESDGSLKTQTGAEPWIAWAHAGAPPQPNAEVPSPSTPTGSMDPQVVGFWELHDNNGNTYYWIIQADGSYRFYGEGSSVQAKPNQGRMSASGGSWETVTDTGKKTGGQYKFQYGTLATTTDGKTWMNWTRSNSMPQGSTSTGDSQQLLKQGTALKEQRRFDEATQVLTAALRADPNLQQAWFQRGICLFDMGNEHQLPSRKTIDMLGNPMWTGPVDLIEMGIKDYTHALKLNPRDARAHCLRGKSLMVIARWNEARPDLDTAIQLDPQYAWAYGYRGVCKIYMAEDGEADMQRCYALDPSLREFFADYVKDAYDLGGQMARSRQHRAELDAKMRAWMDARSEKEALALLEPWTSCGEVQTVSLKFRTGHTEDANNVYVHYTTLTFRAVKVQVQIYKNPSLGPRVAYIPLRKADADAIPEGYRVSIHAPPGVAAGEPDVNDMMTGGWQALGDWLDTMYRTKGKVR